MCDVGERSRMDGGGRAFEGLHQVWLDGVFHQNSDRACHTEVFGCDRFAAFVGGDNHFAKAFAHIFEVSGQRQNSHDLGSDGDVVACAMVMPNFILAQADLHFAQHAVIDIHNAAPGDGGFVNIEPRKT